MGMRTRPFTGLLSTLSLSEPTHGFGDLLAERLRELGRLVATADDIGAIGSYFYDSVATTPGFFERGEPAAHLPLTRLIQAVASTYGAGLLEPRGALNHIAALGFWHGALESRSGSVASVLYFDDQNRGVAALLRSGDETLHHFRFSLPEEARDPSFELGAMEFLGARLRGGRVGGGSN